MFPIVPKRYNREALIALLAAFYPTGPTKAKLRLFTNNFMPDENSQISSFTEADFTGYFDADLTMTAPFNNNLGVILSVSNNLQFLCTAAPALPVTVYGIYVVDEADGILIAAQRFANPQIILATNDTVNGVWRTSMPPSGYGWLSTE